MNRFDLKWRIRDSNAGQAAYESAALPTELMRQIVFSIHSLAGNGSTSLGLMNPLLCQLSYRAKLVMRGELKPKARTFWVSGLRFDPARGTIIAERP